MEFSSMNICKVTLWNLFILGVILLGCLGRTLDHGIQDDKFHKLSRTKRGVDGVETFISDVMSYQEMDMVMVLDRSTGVGPENLYLNELNLAKDIVKRFLKVHPEKARLAVVTFGKDVRTVFDGVARDPMSKCDLVEDSTLWNKVQFVEGSGYADGTNIDGALTVAGYILKAARDKRNRVRQIVLLMTDAELNDVNDVDPKEASEKLRREGVGIYGVGVGENLNQEVLTSLLSDPRNFATLETWKATVSSSYRHIADNQYADHRLTISDACNCPARADCYCDINSGHKICNCVPGYYLAQGTCQATCGTSVCYGDSVCIGNVPTHICLCLPGSYGDDCNQRVDHCAGSPCKNGGTCFRAVQNYVCACPWGWTGQNCDINENECLPGICNSGEACKDDVNMVYCTCADGTPAPCDPTNTVQTGNSSNPDTRQFGVVGEEHEDSKDDNMRRQLLIFLPAGAAALVAVVASIVTLSYVLRHGKRKGPRSLHTDTTSVISRNPSLLTFDSKCYKDEGTPMAPPLDRLDLIYDESIYEEALYGNEPLQRGMEDWFPYVLEMLTSGGLSRVLLVRLDGEKWVLSPGCKFRMSETDNIYKILSKQVARGTVNVQKREFGVVSNEEFFMVGHSTKNDEKHPQEIVCATKTRQFVLVATADFAEDRGRCKAELMRLRVYIKEQGL